MLAVTRCLGCFRREGTRFAVPHRVAVGHLLLFALAPWALFCFWCASTLSLERVLSVLPVREFQPECDMVNEPLPGAFAMPPLVRASLMGTRCAVLVPAAATLAATCILLFL